MYLILPLKYATSFNRLFFEYLYSNGCQVEIIDANNQVVAVMKEGEFFGEMGLVFSIPRTASVRAVSSVSCFSLSKEGSLFIFPFFFSFYYYLNF